MVVREQRLSRAAMLTICVEGKEEKSRLIFLSAHRITLS